MKIGKRKIWKTYPNKKNKIWKMIKKKERKREGKIRKIDQIIIIIKTIHGKRRR